MNITVYSTSTCGICHALMSWLDQQGESYTNVVVDEVPTGMAELMAASGGALGVPYSVVEKDGQKIGIAGFDRPKFQQLFAD